MSTKEFNEGQGLMSAIAAGSRFHYEPLDSTKREIRLLTIHPGNSGSVQCSLHRAPLDHPPKYEALSYTWGDLKKLKEVILHGFHAGKNSQVKLMRDIYANAEQVVVWMSDAFEGSNEAFDLLERLPQIDWSSDNQPLEDYMPDAWKPLAQLLRARWWTRVWTIQELVMSKSAIVRCGTRSVSYEAFHHLALQVAKHLHSGAQVSLQVSYLLTQAESNDLQILSQMRDMRLNGQALPLARLLSTTVTKQATEARDRVIALLGLAEDTDRAAIEPDYAKPIAELFCETTKHLLSSAPYLDFLQDGGLRQQRPENVPSWYIDYAAPLNDWGNRPLLAGTIAFPPQVEWSENTSFMHAKGVDVSHVVYSSAYVRAPGAEGDFSNLGPPPILQTWMAEMDKFERLQWRYRTKSAVLQGFSQTLIAGQALRPVQLKLAPGKGSSEELSPEQVYEAFDAWLSIPIATNPGPKVVSFNHMSEAGRDHASLYRQAATRYLRGRAFIITDDGFLGLAPGDTKVGDRICFLTGASTPVVLRRNGEKYRWVGAAHVDSWMDGQFFMFLVANSIKKMERFTVS